MRDFIEFAHANGYVIASPTLDGKLHRFPLKPNATKKSGWYIAWQNEGFLVGIIGDWTTGRQVKYLPKGAKLDPEQKKQIANKINYAIKKEADDKKARQDKAAALAERIWSETTDTALTPYCQRKKIVRLHGAKTALKDDGRAVVVPCRDIDGKLWGLQFIYDDKKRFLTGQKTMGTFFQLGEVKDRIFICEGWATGVSVREAIDDAVIVSFNAANLVELSKQFRRKFPEKKIIICGDDDTKTEGNPGRTKAEEAGRAVGGNVVFPRVKPGQTDFNDVHVELGVDEVRRQILIIRDENPLPFTPLGFDGMIHHFFSLHMKNLVSITSFTDIQVFMLAGKEYWESTFPGPKGGIDWISVKDYLIKISKNVGRFNPSKIRGSGAWVEGNVHLFNTGTKLYAPEGYNPQYLYINTHNNLRPLHPKPLTVDETIYLRRSCEDLNWADPNSGYLLAGWLALARVCGALPIRPHIWLSAGRDSGKSSVMEIVISAALGSDGKIFAQGCSTEAGVRQSLKGDGLPVIFDEFEAGDNANERQPFIELSRQSWSASKGQIYKGTPGGVHIDFKPAFMALVASIRLSLTNDADRSRFTIMELLRRPDSDSKLEEWQKYLEAGPNHINDEYADRLLARSFKMLPVTKKSFDVFKKIVGQILGSRAGDQYGMLMAGFYSLVSDDVVDEDTAKEMAMELKLTKDSEEKGINDEMEALDFVLESKIRIGSEDIAIATIIGEHMNAYEMGRDPDPFKNRALREFGIIIEKDALYIDPLNVNLKKYILKGSRWYHTLGHSLKRIDGVEKHTGRRFIEGSSGKRCLKIPMDIILRRK